MEPTDGYDELEDFHRWREEKSCTGFRWLDQGMADCQFIPTSEINNYLGRGKIKRLLRIAKATTDPEMVFNNYKKVFCILLTMERANLIDYFCRYDELEDAKLPFQVRPHHFPASRLNDDPWRLFDETQWAFCAQIMLDKGERIYPDMAILPIMKKLEIGSGGSAKIYKIEVHEAYNRLKSKTDPSHGPFALKHFIGRDAERNYRREVDGFKRLMRSPEMPKTIIGCYGGFSQGKSYNIILEYADGGTLERYFQDNGKPRSTTESLQVWEALFNLLEGLHAIHGLKRTNPEQTMFPGWHQDIKPENILVSHTQDGSICFKLADMGNCHFTNEHPSKTVRDTDSRGTRTYGAPECYRGGIDYLEKSDIQVTQKTDIWSLGAVYSEAAAWILGGPGLLNTYRNRRREKRRPNVTDDDCFHDGEKISDAVRDMHEELKHYPPEDDHVTARAIELVHHFMLGDKDLRWDALQLSKAFRDLLDRKRPHSPYSIEYPHYPRSTQGVPPGAAATLSGHDTDTMISPGGLNEYPVRMNSQRSSQGVPPGAAATLSGHDTDTMISPGGLNEYPVRTNNQRSTQGVPPGAAATLSGHDTDTMISPGGLNEYPVKTNNQRSSLPEVAAVLTESQTLSHRPTRSLSRKGNGEIANGGGLDISVISEGRGQFTTHREHPPLTPATDLHIPPEGHVDTTTRNSNNHLHVASVSSINTPELPILDFRTAKQWRIDRKTKVRPLPELSNSWLLNRLQGRDHIFVIDNSETMEPHWNDVVELFEVLSYMVKRTDRDGIELLFTGTSEVYKEKHTSRLIKKVRSMPREGKADMKTTLSRVLYQESLQWSQTRTSVYVFTDGIWESQTDCRKPIKDVVAKLEQRGKPTDHLGLQFISFGTDAVGLDRLRSLDEEDSLPRDIVDTEPFKNGNIWKMLLGVFDETFDRQNEDRR